MSEHATLLEQHPFANALDIYIFSNGQQYSPPRKYHLSAEDLDLWKSTLGFLARSQYGALHSNIELYTIEGKKVFGPLGLSHGASYVAVEPPDKFIYAGYEKYLIRASRSHEKRQSKKFDIVVEPDAPGPKSEIIDESLLQTIVSSTVDHQSSVLVKPEHPKNTQEKLQPLQISSLRIEKKKPSLPRPAFIRKNIPITTPVVKPFFKNRDGIKGAYVKITRPETDKIPPSSSGNPLNKVPAKTKFYKPSVRQKESLPREVSTLTKVKEEHHELNNSCSGIKISNHNGNINLSANNVDIKNIIDDIEVVKVSNFDTNIDTPLADSGMKHHQIIIESALDDAVQDEHKIPNGCQDINTNAITFVVSNKNDTEDLNTTDSPKMGYLFTSNNLAKEQYEVVNESNKLEEYSGKCQNNDQEEIKMININDSPPIQDSRKHSILIMTDKILDNRRESQHISPHPTRENINIITNEVKLNTTQSNENSQFHGLTPAVPDNLGDEQYVAILKRGDVVNLKLNIEIKDRDSCCDKHKDDAINIHSATNIIYTEKGSQINMTSHILMQKKSLLSLITNEIIGCNNVSDQSPVIIVQCGDCKYCKSRDSSISDKIPNKNYLILMPVDKFEEKFKWCHCDKSLPETPNPSVSNPIKPNLSCMSLERITSLNQCEAAERITTHKTDETILFESKGSETGLKRKVAINGECLVATRESSKVFHEINVTSELITCQDYCHSGFKENQYNIQRTLVDNYTQTDWCDVLLEARLLEDGHYSFRLPTLEMLKFYKLGL